jgi:deoxyribodipyrimidine photo-lyase
MGSSAPSSGRSSATSSVLRTAVVLFTRDLRVHDNPALAGAADEFDRVLPLFVLDEDVLRSFGAPNRLAFLGESLVELGEALGGLAVSAARPCPRR